MSSRSATPRLVRIHHRLRSFSFAMMFVATGLHIHDKDYGPLAWTLLALLFLAYPQVQHWWVRRAANPVRLALKQLLVDSFLLGMYAAAMQFSIWLSFWACWPARPSALASLASARRCIPGWPRPFTA